jgi:hypothetical protein
MKNTFFKPDASFAFYLMALRPQGLGWYNKATLRTLGQTEGKKNNTYYLTILNKNTLKNINKFKVRLYYSNQLNIRDSLNLLNRLGWIQNQRKYYHISNIRAVKRIGPHNEEVLSVIIGSLLGDGVYAKNRTGEGVSLFYRQSIRHKESLFFLYQFYYNRGYTSYLQPRQTTRTNISKEGTEYYGYEFNTFTFRSFNWIHRMFYNNGRKVIPGNIYEYLTPLALAVWIMDDGGFANNGIRLATNSFKLKEVELLQDALKSKYNLETTIKNIHIKNQYSIYIKKKSVNNLRNIVGPYIQFSMLHKLG